MGRTVRSPWLRFSARDREWAMDALEKVRLTHLADRSYLELSGGQRQVVTLLMCTLVTPKLLLLDEHTAALDPATAERIMEITKQIVAENKITTLMITHNIRSALSTGTRTLMMDAGRIILDLAGKRREEMTVPELMRLYSEQKKEEFANDRMLLND